MKFTEIEMKNTLQQTKEVLDLIEDVKSKRHEIKENVIIYFLAKKARNYIKDKFKDKSYEGIIWFYKEYVLPCYRYMTKNTTKIEEEKFNKQVEKISIEKYLEDAGINPFDQNKKVVGGYEQGEYKQEKVWKNILQNAPTEGAAYIEENYVNALKLISDHYNNVNNTLCGGENSDKTLKSVFINEIKSTLKLKLDKNSIDKYELLDNLNNFLNEVEVMLVVGKSEALKNNKFEEKPLEESRETTI